MIVACTEKRAAHKRQVGKKTKKRARKRKAA